MNTDILLKVKATDEDTTSTLIFTLDHDNLYFAVNDSTGMMTTLQPLDREERSSHSLNIHISDGLFTQDCEVLIHVSDINDNAPRFVKDSFKAEIRTALYTGQEVMSVVAMDADEFDFMTYWLVGGEGIFTIDPDTGMISVLKVPTHYLGFYKMTVYARDSAIPPFTSYTNVTVAVNSTVKVVPEFDRLGYDIEVEEKEPVSSIIADVIVRNKANCIFEIIDGNTDNVFGISPSGSIFIIKALDFESIQYYTLTINAHDLDDPTLTSDIKVRVTVLDSNDNTPQISPIPERIYLYLPLVPYQSVFQFFAKDMDTMRNRNNEIRFELQNFEDRFIINPETGELKYSANNIRRNIQYIRFC